jgi:hypothetical protein
MRALLVALSLALMAPSAAAEEEDEPVDAGPPNPWASPGPIVERGPLRPAPMPLRACSMRHPVCVHGSKGPDVLATLGSAERAWEMAAGALDLPSPDPHPATGAYDIYLVDRAGADTGLGERDPRGRVDRASAFSRIDVRATGCARDFLVARELLRAVLFRVSPAIDEGSARAQTASLAELIVPCFTIDASLFQSRPDRVIVDTWPEAPLLGARYDEGAALVYDWIDKSFGAEPGAIVRALWALSPTVTTPGAWRWSNEPDTFDVLRASFKNALSLGSTVDDLLREVAVARATMPLPARIDRTIDWPSKPRRFAGEPVAPTGATYFLIHKRDAPAGASLRVELSWEQHAKMRWAAVKLDPSGHEIGHIAIPSADRATEAQMTVVDLDRAADVLLVGTNVGEPLFPFDPDDDVWEPHGWLLTVAAEP